MRDLEATIAFFIDLGLTIVGLDGTHATIAMLQKPGGTGRIELVESIHPVAIEIEPTRPNGPRVHRITF